MPFEFNFGGDIRTFIFETYIGNALVEQRQVTVPMTQVAAMQFAQLCERIAQENQPMKCICLGTNIIEKSDGTYIEKPAKLIFCNNKWEGNME